MKNNKLVSIIITSYNSEEFISKSINSILLQTYQNFEIIIVDDCSTDNTVEVVSELNDIRIKLVVNEYNLGYLHNFNKALKYASGEFITFLDSDDYISEFKLENQIRALEDNNWHFCGTQFIKTNRHGRVIGKSNLPLSLIDIRKAISSGELPACGSSIMVRKEVIDKIGGYRDFFFRMSWGGY
ncbi:glycosyltransferase family 2 protein [Photobacterium kishitanii]|uniref:glycosyltransferase family 2 protein n=1 Tax=Photobacterium kishitanii TaxID=318456 RepID=UPI0007F8947E|nr:glycosyltransferase family 2 protein [Photobacterium kishitanii]OBU24039.1 hypothetical protein AYY23_11505 [Photobacterium kishitanii]